MMCTICFLSLIETYICVDVSYRLRSLMMMMSRFGWFCETNEKKISRSFVPERREREWKTFALFTHDWSFRMCEKREEEIRENEKFSLDFFFPEQCDQFILMTLKMAAILSFCLISLSRFENHLVFYLRIPIIIIALRLNCIQVVSLSFFVVRSFVHSTRHLSSNYIIVRWFKSILFPSSRFGFFFD